MLMYLMIKMFVNVFISGNCHQFFLIFILKAFSHNLLEKWTFFSAFLLGFVMILIHLIFVMDIEP